MPCKRLCDMSGALFQIMKGSSDEVQGCSWGPGQIRGRCRRLVSLIGYWHLSHRLTSPNGKIGLMMDVMLQAGAYHGQESVFGLRTDTLS